MKKILFLFSLILISQTSFADDTQTFNADQAREDYRIYMQQLKALGKQYGEVTAEMKKILKEEGVPTWDANTGQVTMAPFDSEDLEGVRIKEEDKEMIVSIDLPGFKKNSLKVTLKDSRTLQVAGKRVIEGQEIAYERAIPLPQFAQEKGTKAKYEDGVLVVRILKNPVSQREVNVPIN